jgi:hypothetical protein
VSPVDHYVAECTNFQSPSKLPAFSEGHGNVGISEIPISLCPFPPESTAVYAAHSSVHDPGLDSGKAGEEVLE